MIHKRWAELLEEKGHIIWIQNCIGTHDCLCYLNPLRSEWFWLLFNICGHDFWMLHSEETLSRYKYLNIIYNRKFNKHRKFMANSLSIKSCFFKLIFSQCQFSITIHIFQKYNCRVPTKSLFLQLVLQYINFPDKFSSQLKTTWKSFCHKFYRRLLRIFLYEPVGTLQLFFEYF